jgi:hypothetical protein
MKIPKKSKSGLLRKLALGAALTASLASCVPDKKMPPQIENLRIETPENERQVGRNIKLKGHISKLGEVGFAYADKDIQVDSGKCNLFKSNYSAFYEGINTCARENLDFIIRDMSSNVADPRVQVDANGNFEVNLRYSNPKQNVVASVGITDSEGNNFRKDVSVSNVLPYQNPIQPQDDDDDNDTVNPGDDDDIVNDDDDDATNTCTFNDRCIGTGFIDWNNNRIVDSVDLDCNTIEPGAIYVQGICGAECSLDLQCHEVPVDDELTRDTCVLGTCSNTPIGTCLRDDQCHEVPVDNPLTLDRCVNNGCVNDVVYQCVADLDCNENNCDRTYTEECTSPTGLSRTYLGDLNGDRIQNSENIIESCQNLCDIVSGEQAGLCRTDCTLPTDCASPVVDYSCVIGVCGANCESDLDCVDGDNNTTDVCNGCLCDNIFTGQCRTNDECHERPIDNPLTVDSCDIPNAQCHNVQTYECTLDSQCSPNGCGPATFTEGQCVGLATIEYEGHVNGTLEDVVIQESCNNNCAFDFPNDVTNAGYCTDCTLPTDCAEPVRVASCIPNSCGAQCAVDSDCPTYGQPFHSPVCSGGCACNDVFTGECETDEDCPDNPLMEGHCDIPTATCDEYVPTITDEASARQTVYATFGNYFNNVIGGLEVNSLYDLFGFGIVPEDDEYNVYRNNNPAEAGSAITAGYNFKGYPNASTAVPDFDQAVTDTVNAYNSCVENPACGGGYVPVTIREINYANPKMQTSQGLIDCVTSEIVYHLTEGIVDTREEDCE